MKTYTLMVNRERLVEVIASSLREALQDLSYGTVRVIAVNGSYFGANY